MARRSDNDLPQTQTDYLPFNGGLDEVTSTWEVKPGRLRQAVNYEIAINGGYQDILGYERYDGRALPSESVYTILPAELTGSWQVGDIIHGDGYVYQRFSFESGLEEWIGSNDSTLTWVSPGLIEYEVQGPSANPYISLALASSARFIGCNVTRIRMKVRRTAGIGGLDYRCYYQTEGHGRDFAYHKQAATPGDPSEWHIIEWDMSNLTSGGTDWIDSQIWRVTMDLSEGANASGDKWEIQWIEFGMPGSGASARIAGYQDGNLILADQTGNFDLDETLWIDETPVGVVAGQGLRGDRPFTIECVIEGINPPFGPIVTINYDRGDPNTGRPARGIGLNLANTNRFSAHVIHEFPDNALQATTEHNSYDGQRRHVALTYDGSKTAAGLKIYIDGVLMPRDTSQDIQTLVADEITAPVPPTTLRIGGRPLNHEGANPQFLLGKIADVRVWKSERTAQQINACRGVRLSGKEEHLMGYWPLDEGSGGVVADKTGTAPAGQFVGEPQWVTESGFPTTMLSLDGASAVDVAHYYGAPEIAAPTAAQSAAYQAIAANLARAGIDKVPGSGRVLGVYQLGNTVYAFRNNEAGDAAEMWASSPTGWQQVDLGLEIEFAGGTNAYEIKQGDVITGATSGATATVERVIVSEGDWTTNDAAGRLILSGQVGTFQAEDLNIDSNTSVATIAGDSSAITLLPDGRYEFWEGKFGRRGLCIYGADGANPGFEFDGRVFVPIYTGMVPDAPTHVCVHQNHLFFSFGPSVQHSAIGDPYLWSPLLGAAELSVQDDVTGFQPEPGSQGGAALGIYSRNLIHILYGSSSDEWTLVPYRDKLGAYPYSIQQLSQTIFLDDRGITSLMTSQAYGNFEHSTLTQAIHPTINQKRSSITASCIVRDKNQARFFFNDGSGLYMTFSGQKLLGIIPVQFPDPVRCMFSIEGPDGREQIMFGSDDGYVYKMESGYSFDGDAIPAHLMLHYHHSKDPRRNKRYTGVELEASGTGYAEFSFTYELGYAGTDIAQPLPRVIDLNLMAAFWDSFIWDAAVWDGHTLSPTWIPIDGEAHNISLIIRKESDAFAPIRFSGALLEYRWRRKLR